MENHAGRQEVQEALENGSGESSRYSDTLLQQTLYVARRLTDGTVLFELVQGDTTMDFLMEAVPEDAEPAAAE